MREKGNERLLYRKLWADRLAFFGRIARMQHYSELRQKFNTRKVDFIKTDLEAAIKFVKIAKESHDAKRTARNRANEQRAHDAVLHTSCLVPRSHEEIEITQGLAFLKSLPSEAW